MNRGVKLITILLVILLVSVSLAWTDSITVRLTSGQAHPDSVGSPEATPLADDNKIVCCWKCPDDGLMKCKVDERELLQQRWVGKSHPAVNANNQNSGGVDYHDQLGVLTAQIS